MLIKFTTTTAAVTTASTTSSTTTSHHAAPLSLSSGDVKGQIGQWVNVNKNCWAPHSYKQTGESHLASCTSEIHVIQLASATEFEHFYLSIMIKLNISGKSF